ncbi:hypothetical protein KI387_032361, partial [Taxus chinensis]
MPTTGVRFLNPVLSNSGPRGARNAWTRVALACNRKDGTSCSALTWMLARGWKEVVSVS